MFINELKILNDHNGNMSLEHFQYCTGDSDYTNTLVRNLMEMAGLVKHRYGRLLLSEAGKQHLTTQGLPLETAAVA